MAGPLFLRSHAEAERVQLAMRARGFAGELPTVTAPPLGRAELVAVGGLLALALCGLLRGGVQGTVAAGGACGRVFQDPDDQLFASSVAQDVACGPRNQWLAEPEVAQRVAPRLTPHWTDGRRR